MGIQDLIDESDAIERLVSELGITLPSVPTSPEDIDLESSVADPYAYDEALSLNTQIRRASISGGWQE